jgi:hypothetical protein
MNAKKLMIELSKRLETRKLCKDCKWMTQPPFIERLMLKLTFAKCAHPRAQYGSGDLVSGAKREQMYCSTMRDFYCGEEGKFWESKEETK